MRRFESDFRGHPGIEGLFPPTCTKAPAVTGLESGELHVRPGRREVVALLERVFQKFLCHHRADGVNPRITWSGVAIAITEKPRHRFVAARLQIASQDISRHGPDRKCRHGLVPARKISVRPQTALLEKPRRPCSGAFRIPESRTTDQAQKVCLLLPRQSGKDSSALPRKNKNSWHAYLQQ